MYARHAQLLGDRSAYFGSRRDEILELVPGEVERVLEVGCGTGATIAVLRSRGCEVVGVDIAPAAVEEARRVLDAAHALDAEEEDLPYEPGYFDLLILHHVLEHMVNPWEALRRLVSYVRRDGYVIVGVPNIAHYRVLARLILHDQFVHEPYGVLDWTHLRYFTRSSLETTLLGAGLSIVECRGQSIAIEGSWKARAVVRLFPPLRRFFNFAYLVLARKVGPPPADYVPFGEVFSV